MSIEANWPRCTSCHVGYGWQSASFNFNDESKVDCLVCHDTTGEYKKTPTGAGMPDPVIDLLYIARNVGKSTRQNCGNCHFFGGGGDAVKHGDLDSSILNPTPDIDVHMATDGANFSCQNCHVTNDHFITGNAMVVSPTNQDHIGCAGCHQGTPHSESVLNKHMKRVACQTCHIPAFAKKVPTKTSWDWSTAGSKMKSQKDEHGKPTFAKKKGSFTWGKNITPTYAWYNGQSGVYQLGDKMDPTKVTKLNYPIGSKNDPTAKIYPFKNHKGKQPYDKQNNYFTTVHLFGKGGYWKTFDWTKSIAAGMKSSGVPFSGEYSFAETIMYWPINHMVSPAEQALSCLDCHGDKGRMDWKALGYSDDPLKR